MCANTNMLDKYGDANIIINTNYYIFDVERILCIIKQAKVISDTDYIVK